MSFKAHLNHAVKNRTNISNNNSDVNNTINPKRAKIYEEKQKTKNIVL